MPDGVFISCCSGISVMQPGLRSALIVFATRESVSIIYYILWFMKRREDEVATAVVNKGISWSCSPAGWNPVTLTWQCQCAMQHYIDALWCMVFHPSRSAWHFIIVAALAVWLTFMYSWYSFVVKQHVQKTKVFCKHIPLRFGSFNHVYVRNRESQAKISFMYYSGIFYVITMIITSDDSIR